MRALVEKQCRGYNQSSSGIFVLLIRNGKKFSISPLLKTHYWNKLKETNVRLSFAGIC